MCAARFPRLKYEKARIGASDMPRCALLRHIQTATSENVTGVDENETGSPAFSAEAFGRFVKF